MLLPVRRPARQLVAVHLQVVEAFAPRSSLRAKSRPWSKDAAGGNTPAVLRDCRYLGRPRMRTAQSAASLDVVALHATLTTTTTTMMKHAFVALAMLASLVAADLTVNIPGVVTPDVGCACTFAAARA